VRRRIRTTVIGAAVIGAALRIAAALFAQPISHNGAAYLLPQARALLAGEGWLSAVAPPLYPALAAALAWIGDLEWAGKIISILAGTMVIPLAFGIGRRLFGIRAGLWAAWIAAVMPGLVRFSGEAQEDMTHAFLFTLALSLAIRTARRPRVRRAIAAGIAAGLGYLVRPESVAILPLLAGGLLFEAVRRRRRGARIHARPRIAAFALAAIAFGAAVSPYVVWVHGRYGIWTISPKARILADYGDADGEGLQRISPRDPSRTVHEVRIQEPAALAQGDRAARVRTDPGSFARTFFSNWTRFAGQLPEVAGAGFVFAAIIGIACRWRFLRPRLRMSGLAWTAASAGIIACGIAAFYVSRRFWLPALPILCGLLGAGAEALAIRAGGGITAGRRLFAAIILALLVLPQTAHVISRDGLTLAESPERRAGRELARRTSPGEGVLSAKALGPFYADRPSVPIPDESAEDVLAFARRRGARYLEADPEWLAARRPSLWDALEAGRAGAEVERFQGVGREVCIWRIRSTR